MKIRILLLTTFVLISTSAISQTAADSIAGKWKFQDVYNKSKLDSTQLALLRMSFADMTMDFKTNGAYKLVSFKVEEGTWTFEKEGRFLITVSNRGKETRLRVISITDSLLIFSMEREKSFIFQKTSVGSAD